MKAVSFTVSLICSCHNVIRTEMTFKQNLPALAECLTICDNCGNKFFAHIQESKPK